MNPFGPLAIGRTSIRLGGLLGSILRRGTSLQWFDAAEWDRWAWIVLGDGRAAVATGPKADGKYPKRAALASEVLDIIGPAGRPYLPASRGDYRTDTPENALRIDHYRGRPQISQSPIPRFNRTPREFIAEITPLLLQYPYVVSVWGEVGAWLEFIGPSIPGGRWEIHAEGVDVWVWSMMPHGAAENVRIIPHGNIHYATADTHGVTGHNPNFPMPPIPNDIYPTTAHQAAEEITVAESVRAQIAAGGSMLVQGQFYAPGMVSEQNPDGKRFAMGWQSYRGLAINADGEVVCSAGFGSDIVTPLGVGGNGDPFRLVASWLDRDEGTWSRPGFTRAAGNGGPAGEFSWAYGGGLGGAERIWLGRNYENTHGAYGGGGFDVLAFTPDTFEVGEVSALSAYPGFVAGLSPKMVTFELGE